MNDDHPKTLAEMAAAADVAGSAANQWQCARCGGKQWWVRNSYFVERDGTRHRKRECRRCHGTLYTRESITCSKNGKTTIDD